MEPNDTCVCARIDAYTKARATDVLEAMGLSISDAIRLLILRVAQEHRLPFDAKRVFTENWNQYAERSEAQALAAEAQISAERIRKTQAIDGQTFRHTETGRIYQVYGNTALIFESIEQWRKGISMGGCSVTRIIELLDSGLVARCA
jgi:DNA-damage-inducible protein J